MNKKNGTPFREQLLSQEKSDTQLQKTFHQEVKKMYTENLKKGQRFAYILASSLIAFFTLFFWIFSKMFKEIQIKHEIGYLEPLRLASTWAMFLSLALVLLSLWPAIRGKVGLRFYPKIVRFVFWILILTITTLYLAMFDVIEEHVQSGISTEITWVFTMMTLVIVMGVYMLLSGRIDRGDMKNKAKTLELECRIAELEEKLNQKEN